MICPKCLSEIKDDSLFCSICGSDLTKEETRKIPLSNCDNGKTNLSKVSIIIAIIACILFFVSTEQISKVANDMINLRSEAGTSLAEVYYQDIGKALKGFAMFIRAFGVSILAIIVSVFSKEHRVVS